MAYRSRLFDPLPLEAVRGEQWMDQPITGKVWWLLEKHQNHRSLGEQCGLIDGRTDLFSNKALQEDGVP